MASLLKWKEIFHCIIPSNIPCCTMKAAPKLIHIAERNWDNLKALIREDLVEWSLLSFANYLIGSDNQDIHRAKKVEFLWPRRSKDSEANLRGPSGQKHRPLWTCSSRRLGSYNVPGYLLTSPASSQQASSRAWWHVGVSVRTRRTCSGCEALPLRPTCSPP